MEGRRKEVLLLVLALVALGLALYTFRGKPASPPPPGPPGAAERAPAPGPTGAEAPRAAQGGEQQAGPAATDERAGAGATQRNPFSAPGAPTAGAGPPLGSDLASAGSEVESGPDMPEWADSSLVLTGIVEGKSDVAILRQGDQRFFVKVGDPIGGGYRVQSIGHQQVVLAGRQGNVILRMGGRQ